MLRKVLPLMAAPFLSGCIGSAIIVDPDHKLEEFPSLHTVPDKPPAPDFKRYENAQHEVQAQQQEELKRNHDFREKFLGTRP